MSAQGPGDDIAAIERSTLAGVQPQALEELQSWLLALDDGTVGRAHSAVPLSHTAPAAGLLPAIVERYAAHGLSPVLRVPRKPAYDAFRALLAGAGFHASKPTLAQLGTVAAMAQVARPDGVTLADAPDAHWAAVFMGEGFDPADGESRMAILRRSPCNVFASAWLDGRVAAVGSASFAHGWVGVHGMRTAPAQRGRGLAGRILAALAEEAQRRGFGSAVLQVEEPNTGARSLYRRAGFSTAWAYEYWLR
ncbi:MAG: GNAT family N-acetyltransferase [Ramlibacter sp.]